MTTADTPYERHDRDPSTLDRAQATAADHILGDTVPSVNARPAGDQIDNDDARLLSGRLALASAVTPTTPPSPQEKSMETDEQTTTPRMTTARSRELGEELRRIRHRARKSSADTAAALGWSLGKLSKLETGSRGTSPWEIGVLTGRLGADKPTR
ncbi:hypothetical protein ADK67_09820, partial [Saccharothrix sp. NRRL B-16348]|uniref:helix-turn-helix domain-containing protein n=1 Tax=Saccharothrix sp. NRRL B-16348 TaxID=1415542 RepID=UPI0006C47880